MCAFPFCIEDSFDRVDNSVGHVRSIGSGVFILMGIDSNCEVVPLVMFVPIVVESKGGRLIELFWRPKS